MLNQVNPFYNPYPLPYLPFFLPHTNDSANFLKNQDENFFDEGLDIISSLGLHTQTEDPILTLGVCFPIWSLFTITAIFIQVRTLNMLKQENSVNNMLMVTQAKLHIIFWPMMMTMIELTDNIYPLAAYTPNHFCTVLSVIINFFSLCIILYSFYAALLRYMFCSHSNWVENFGKERLIRIIYWVFYVHAFLWAVGNKLLRFSLDAVPMINSCYGWSDRVFMLELHDSANVVKRHFCGFDSVDGMRNYCVKYLKIISYKY